MTRTPSLFRWGTTLLSFLGFCAPALSGASALSTEQFQGLLAEYCHRCHGGEKTKGKVDLVSMRTRSDFLGDSGLLEELLAVLEDEDMPPETSKPLSAPARAQLVTTLRQMLGSSLVSEPFESTPIRRMNRFQYNNAVKDLLGLERDIFWMPERLMRRRSNYFKPGAGKMPDNVQVQNRPLGKDHDGERPEGFKEVAAFPQDRRAEHGFDNRADHLTLSPLLMEQFLQLSQSIVESQDLNSRECRTWNSFFAVPRKGDPLTAVRERLPGFLRRAFRKPPEDETLERFLSFAERELRNGAGFTETMKTLVGATLSSPEFLYLYDTESEPTGSPAEQRGQKVNDFELATRLSFFLWASIPDDQLLDLAEAGELGKPDILSGQIDRMLLDPRTARFCDIFPAQWLQLDRLISSIPDREKFPRFYLRGYRASMHMMMEPLLLFESVYLENRPVLELLDPKFSWRSQLLSTIYAGQKRSGIAVQTVGFARVPVTDPRWGGVMTNAAVMTMTSGSERTLPITRGAWVNTVIFNDPPEPPPADVPPLPEADEEKLSKLTIRERFAEHRVREDCASCHKQIDPLGFALENYGPTGTWRDTYENGREIDPSGRMFNRHSFRNPVEFKESILKERRRFMRGFSAHLLSFSLGRKLGPADSPSLDQIADRAMAGDDSLRAIMKMIAMSEPFHYKNTSLPEPGKTNHEH